MPTWNGYNPDIARIRDTFWESNYWGYLTGAVGIVWWQDVQVPRGATILSATLTHGSREGSGQFGAIAHDSLPEPTTGTWTEWSTAPVVDSMWTGGGTSNVTAMVQAVVDRPGWASGNNIAFRGTAGNWKYGRSQLSIEWEESTQEIDPVVVTGHARVSDVLSVDTAVNPALVVAHSRVSAVEIVAPRAVYVNPLDARARVGQASLSGTGAGPSVQVAGVLTAAAEVLIPTLARTVPPEPPPIPWERLIVDPLFHEALASRRRQATSRVDVISPDDAVIAQLGGPDATHPGTLSGTVQCRGSASIRWECDLVLDNPDLLPMKFTDLLHPLSLNRLRVWWGVRLSTGVIGWVPVGTYHPDLTPTSDSGGAPSVQIKGSSTVAEIKKATWDTAVDLSGLTVSDAIAKILTNRAPWAKVSITPTDQRVSAMFEAGEPGADPWSDVESLAYAAGMVAYEDRMGVIRVEPRPTPAAPVSDFTEGPGTALVEIQNVETDMAWAVNKVTVASASPDVDPPVTGVAIDDDPSSPLGRAFNAGRLYHRRVENAIITTEQAATTMARNLLADRAPVVRVVASVYPHPHLDPGDTVTIGRGQVGVAGDHTLEEWTLGLTPGDLQTISVTSRKEAV